MLDFINENPLFSWYLIGMVITGIVALFGFAHAYKEVCDEQKKTNAMPTFAVELLWAFAYFIVLCAWPVFVLVIIKVLLKGETKDSEKKDSKNDENQ